MKIVTRSGVFETNSSSVHSYTCPIKSERISFKGWARSKADKDKVLLARASSCAKARMYRDTNLLQNKDFSG